MQNVLVDDRRIWVDLYVLTILFDSSLTSFRAQLAVRGTPQYLVVQ
jgi:hypothetical protein